MARLTKSAIFDAAARALVEDGQDALKIDVLVRRLGVTKGSFYHHFDSRDGFVREFLEYLRRRAVLDVTSDIAGIADPQERLTALVEVVATVADMHLEAAVRRWAVVEPRVARHVAEVDRLRGDLVRGAYRDLTGDRDRAAYLTRMAMAFFLGAALSEPPVTGDEYRRMAGDLARARVAGGTGAAGERP